MEQPGSFHTYTMSKKCLTFTSILNMLCLHTGLDSNNRHLGGHDNLQAIGNYSA